MSLRYDIGLSSFSDESAVLVMSQQLELPSQVVVSKMFILKFQQHLYNPTIKFFSVIYMHSAFFLCSYICLNTFSCLKKLFYIIYIGNFIIMLSIERAISL